MRVKKSNRRDDGWCAQLLSVNNLLRAIVLLGFFSLFVNILYYSRLPTRKTSSTSQSTNDNSSGGKNGVAVVSDVRLKKNNLNIPSESDVTNTNNKGGGNNNKNNNGKGKTKKTFQGELVGGQLIKKDKHGKEVFHAMTALEAKGLDGDEGVEEKLAKTMTLEEASVGREKILEHLREAGIQEFDVATVLKLPTQEQVEKLYGKGPVVYGLDKCDYFQQHIPKDDASVGSSGIFNSGTNTYVLNFGPIASATLCRNIQLGL